jgi:hypothetical protein
MYNLELWIDKGTFCPRPTRADGGAISDRKLLHHHNLVKLESGQSGTCISWVMFGANWSSLYFLQEFVISCVAPVTLRYFNAGWFEETVETVVDARRRLQELLAKSDVRFAERAYVESFEQGKFAVPDLLMHALDHAPGTDDSAITCLIDTNRELVTVESVGRDSLVGKIWGVSTVSFPCQTGHNYDRVVSRSYFDVLHNGKPHIDHVLAALVRPDGEVGWIGYQRLIMPEGFVTNGVGRVKVVSEFAPVGIRLL